MGVELTAERFVERLTALVPTAARAEFRRAHRSGKRSGVEGFGIRMGSIFELAKEFIDLSPEEIETLLDSPVHEVRVGALSVMDKQARRNRTPEDRRKELFDLYLRRTDAIDTWDLVDLGAPHVVGRYLWERPRKVLYRLARSKRPSERRTAIVSTLYFVRKGDVEDTFELAKAAPRRRRCVRPEGDGRTAPGSRQERRRSTQELPRGPCRNDGAHDTALRHGAPHDCGT